MKRRALEQQISIQPGYVLVKRPPGYKVIREEQSAELMKISAYCKEADCGKVLVLGPRTTVMLSGFEIFNLGEEIAKLGLQIAVVESHNASKGDVRLLESLVNYRGCPFKFFDNEQYAKDWLGIT